MSGTSSIASDSGNSFGLPRDSDAQGAVARLNSDRPGRRWHRSISGAWHARGAYTRETTPGAGAFQLWRLSRSTLGCCSRATSRVPRQVNRPPSRSSTCTCLRSALNECGVLRPPRAPTALYADRARTCAQPEVRRSSVAAAAKYLQRYPIDPVLRRSRVSAIERPFSVQ
jgi:hypothetical protein